MKVWETAQWVNRLACKSEFVSLDFQYFHNKLGAVESNFKAGRQIDRSGVPWSVSLAD